jgi:hypothetical protein
MAYEDYLPGGKKDPNAKAGGIDEEIDAAGTQQQARQQDPVTGQFVSTPEAVDWEKRYKDLEVMNSRQAQDLGTYRKMVDEYIINSPTPETEPVVAEPVPITVDELYDNPDEALNRVIDSHPAIREARQVTEDARKRDLENDLKDFQTRHPDFNEISHDPQFAQWVEAEPMRVELYNRGNQYDLSAADALFSLYKAENNISQMTEEQDQAIQIAAVSLEDSSSVMVNESPKYSRSEYVDTYQRAKQGDLEAERWIQRNSAGYRQALTSGNVRD